jgi:hypothetical protein
LHVDVPGRRGDDDECGEDDDDDDDDGEDGEDCEDCDDHDQTYDGDGEDSDDDFWLNDERCIQECHIHPGIVDKLFSRSTEDIEWISDISQVITTIKPINSQPPTSSTISKIHDFPSSIKKVTGVQLTLF